MRQIGMFFRRWRTGLVKEEGGQAATEYVLVISVLVIAIMAAMSPFVDPSGPFQQGMKDMSENIGSAVASPNSPLLSN